MNTTIDTTTARAFAAQAAPHRQAYRAGQISYTEMRRRINAIPCAPTPRTQCRAALSWLRKARAAGKAMLWWQHKHYLAAARRSIQIIALPVWRARMICAADAIEAMDTFEVSHA